jgi:hypothetical protein
VAVPVRVRRRRAYEGIAIDCTDSNYVSVVEMHIDVIGQSGQSNESHDLQTPIVKENFRTLEMTDLIKSDIYPFRQAIDCAG